MTVRPSLVRSIPFWILLVGSVAVGVFGAWLAFDKLGVMEAALLAGTATGVEVYVGQVWAIVGGILIATGVVGLALALVLAVLRSFVAAPAVEIIEVVGADSDEDYLDDEPEAVVVDELVAPVATEAPVSTEEPVATETTPQR